MGTSLDDTLGGVLIVKVPTNVWMSLQGASAREMDIWAKGKEGHI